MIFYYRNLNRPIYMSERVDGWFDIEKYSIPDYINKAILTDGVQIRIEESFEYNKKGKLIMGWNKREVLFWMPVPKSP